MTITLRNLDLQVQDLASALASSKQISQELLGVLPLISKTHPQEAWRASAQYYFDQSLDAAALMYGTTKRAVSSAYANYIEPLFNKVKTDVAAKLTPAIQPATQPDMPPIPTSAA